MLFVLYRLTSFHNAHSRERFAFARRWFFDGVACSNNGGNKFILCYIKQRSRISLSEAGCPGTRLSSRLPDPAHERLAVAACRRRWQYHTDDLFDGKFRVVFLCEPAAWETGADISSRYNHNWCGKHLFLVMIGLCQFLLHFLYLSH